MKTSDSTFVYSKQKINGVKSADAKRRKTLEKLGYLTSATLKLQTAKPRK